MIGTKGLPPLRTSLQSTYTDQTSHASNSLTALEKPPLAESRTYLETFQKEDSKNRDATLLRNESNSFAFKHLWEWARLGTAPVPRHVYSALLTENDALREDNARLREALERATQREDVSRKVHQTLDEEVGAVLKDLIDPLLKSFKP